MKTSFRFISIIVILYAFLPLQAQQKHEIKILAKNKNSNIWLRWAPSNPVVWHLGNKYGYHIERFDLLKDGKLLENIRQNGVRLTDNPIKPASITAMEKMALEDERIEVLIETIHNKDTTNTLSSPADLIQYKNDAENEFGFSLFVCDLSRTIARAAGLFFSDENVEPGHRYAYRISLAHVPDGIVIEPAVKTIDSQEKEDPLTSIEDLEAKFADRKVTLAWPEMKYYGIYSAYYIQKSKNGEKFGNLTELPYIHISENEELDYQYYVDSLPNNEIEFQYRIIGLTPFGELSKPSNVVKGSGIDELFGSVFIDTVIQQNNSNLINFIVNPALEDEIEEIYIAKASNPDGPFDNINKKAMSGKNKSVIDKQPGYNNYYIVRYKSRESGKLYQSFPFLAQKEDDVPPQIPIGVTGSIDTTGLAKIYWNQNSDNDLLGYRVFTANALHEEFIEVSDEILTKPKFEQQLSLNNLSRDIYYRIIAVDKRYNTSDYSKILKISKPDKISPVAPVFTEEIATAEGIILKWINSVSKDVASYQLHRKLENAEEWKLVTEWHSKTSKDSVIDNDSLRFNQTYHYQLIAIDSSNNRSLATSIPVYYSIANVSGATQLAGVINQNKKAVNISWQSDEPIIGYQVYRAVNENNWQLYHTEKSNKNEFLDTNLRASTIYRYKVKLRYENGMFGGLSKELEIKF
jgi:uncharacterized protein